MHNEWRKSTLVPIYKNKKDIQSCVNYCGIKLLSHMIKFWKRLTELGLGNTTKVKESQFEFMPVGFTIEVIFLLRRSIKIYRKKKFPHDIY